MPSPAHPLHLFASQKDHVQWSEEHDEKVSIGGRTFIILQFADEIDALSEEDDELNVLVEVLGKTCAKYKMKLDAVKTKRMSACASNIQRNSRIKTR